MWFTENPWPPIFLFLSGAVVFGIAWSGAQRMIYLAGIGLMLALAGGTYYLEQAIVTDREQIDASVHDLVRQFQRQNRPGTLQYISTSPQAKTLYDLADHAIDVVEVGNDIHVTDVQVEVLSQGTRASSHFRVNGTVGLRGHGAGSHFPFRFRARWQKEPAGWKMVEIQDLDPINGNELNRFNYVNVPAR
ncbi:hypothetical protein [Planctomyces sp. SH-PL14]|uniref:hypothetical protein n=1 Tax=Planctomyces sp. SH-PL14 TaxID=1632864 RepID=UPI00078D1A29|nr:hypothetical protein [Planctomyces sp. SH-PL14]AMV21067.1 hypothetical protein VT03_24400 [Planctomyces sp. SH-PL14]